MRYDSELLMLAYEGNEEAEKQLFIQYDNVIKYQLKKYKHSLSIYNLDYTDVYYDCLKCIKIALINYNGFKENSFKTYLTKIVDNEIKGILKKSSYQKNKMFSMALYNTHLFDEKGISFEECISDNTNNPLNILTSNEDILTILKLLKDDLSHFEYQVIQLKLMNVSIKEIADILHKDLKQVYNSLYRIRIKLKDKLLK